MPFKSRMRKAFGRSSSSSTELKPKRTKSQEAECYKPGEVLPNNKYPGRPNKPHQDMLRGFSFGDAFKRRSSVLTDISPMGSRMPSRKNSEARGKKSSQFQRSHMGQSVQHADESNGGPSNPRSADRDSEKHKNDTENLTTASTEKQENGIPGLGTPLFTDAELAAFEKPTLQAPGITGVA
ncbi:MAG: hypothetical protein M1825_004653 [Sarcosagium campestre]|nr:MAG: hypothetical protein M1825_004653 [Sarcosagium campestre]